MIRQAETRDLDAVEQGYTDLLTHEAETGSNSNWVLGVYPTRADRSRRPGPGANSSSWKRTGRSVPASS